MIIEEKVKDLVIIGEDTSKKAKISGDKLAKLQYLLTKGLYKDPITAVVAEWTNNGIDSVVQAGKDPIENPVLVKIEKNPTGQFVFSVEDKGVGLDNKDFEDICMNYLESTKEEDNDTIGHFGIGMKSFLSLERSATFTCRKNFIERKYLVYEGAEFVNYDLIYERETTEENGVKAELNINSWNEKELFIKKAKAKLAYYDTAVLIIEGSVVVNSIHRSELYQYSTLNQNVNLHLSLKDVYYPIDYEALGISPIPVGIAIRLELGDGLTPTPSRESYITNEKTKELLLGKIKLLAEHFVTKYNDKVREFKNILEAYKYLGENTYNVNIGPTTLVINPFQKYSSTTITTTKVDGITLRDPNDYKIRVFNWLQEFDMVGYMNSDGFMKTKEDTYVKSNHVALNRGKTILVGENFKGNVKDFLKRKYGISTLYLRSNKYKRPLGKVGDPSGLQSYRQILNLQAKPRKDWRKYINEWNFVVSTVVATFIDERRVDSTKEYQDWLEAKRELQRQRRRGTGRNTKGLNKKQDDVTLAYAYKSHVGISFKKGAYPIAGLTTNKFLTVLITDEDDLDLVKGLYLAVKHKVRFALVGRKEIRKVPDHYQFINLKKFMSMDCKPFMRIASAIKFSKAIKELKSITGYRDGILNTVLKPLLADKIALEEYIHENLSSCDIETEQAILDVADKYKLYDQSLWDVYLRIVENNQKYDFIHLLAEPNIYDKEAQKKYKKLITQLLLFRKKYYDDLPEGISIVFENDKNT